jgi:ribokinase
LGRAAVTENAPILTIIGSLNLDTVVRVEQFPATGETRVGHSTHFYPGGKGANQATAAAHLNGRSRLLGCCGTDDIGDSVLSAVASTGVDVSQVQRSTNPTGAAYILIDRDGENQIVVSPGANSDYVFNPDSINLSDPILCQLEIGIGPVLEAAHHTTGFFAINAAPALDLPDQLIDRADLIVVNETEYAQLGGLPTARLVAVSLGAAGACIYERGVLSARSHGVPAVVRSTVGAGDAFCAALVSGLLKGDSPHNSLEVACAVGSHTVTLSDSQPPLAPLATYK